METINLSQKKEHGTHEQTWHILRKQKTKFRSGTSTKNDSAIRQPRFDSVKIQPLYAFETRKPVCITDRLSLVKKGLKTFYQLTKKSLGREIIDVQPETHPCLAFLKLVNACTRDENKLTYVQFDEKLNIIGICIPKEIPTGYRGYSFDVQFLKLIRKRKTFHALWFDIISVIYNVFGAPGPMNCDIEGVVQMMEEGMDGYDKEERVEVQAAIDMYNIVVVNFEKELKANKNCLKSLEKHLLKPMNPKGHKQIEMTNNVIKLVMELVDEKFYFPEAIFYDEDAYNGVGQPVFDIDRFGILWSSNDSVYEQSNEYWSSTANEVGIVSFSELIITKFEGNKVITESNGMEKKIEKAKELYQLIIDTSILIEKNHGKYHEFGDS